ncbi:quinoprotein relay system zinc metallohydrolase 2 [Rubellimicrobium aerolatum]|uniref:Quinoprotein relay system zinc metallohydrolase 2 n=1 Tax=Rubellimicrobium aerolatum TaxID=490979 RepID=A0ABW0SGE3_9RHOB|nr:quinoprotein relay system zinc metallohydrolase 2 [Rubellimicrobium aerolatum]MBP1807431.1 quinoprotein relay system zinc metallohydrolase 2 [Rubellimicrobium aerolatum]
MIDVLVMLCGLDGGGCATRAVPAGATTCAEARAAAAPRLVAWERAARVEGVRCGAMDAPAMEFEEVAPGLFVHRGAVALADAANGGDIGNTVIVVGAEAVAVIDPGGSRVLGEAVVAAVRGLTDRPIRFAILTHGHPDHVLGATALADAGAEVVAPAGLAEGLALRATPYLEQGARQVGAAFLGSEVPEVDRDVTDMEVLDLGGREIELRAWPVAHSGADLTVLDRATGTLVAGDVVVEGHLPTLDGSLAGWLGVLDALEGSEATRVVPGHGGPVLPWPEAAGPVRRYLGVLGADVRALLAEGATLGEAAAVAAAGERGAWTLFDEHNPRNATVAYTELEWE